MQTFNNIKEFLDSYPLLCYAGKSRLNKNNRYSICYKSTNNLFVKLVNIKLANVFKQKLSYFLKLCNTFDEFIKYTSVFDIQNFNGESRIVYTQDYINNLTNIYAYLGKTNCSLNFLSKLSDIFMFNASNTSNFYLSPHGIKFTNADHRDKFYWTNLEQCCPMKNSLIFSCNYVAFIIRRLKQITKQDEDSITYFFKKCNVADNTSYWIRKIKMFEDLELVPSKDDILLNGYTGRFNF